MAIVDIGSNSVRLVVYSGATRAPSVIFNEKVMAGLGRGLAEEGRLPEDAQARALAALARFRTLSGHMGVARCRVVATAAVRDAGNGAAFLDEVRALGFSPEVLPGDEEARMAGLGVLSSILNADGLVGDLGGGSLELVDVGQGQVRRSVSLPLGVLRLDALLAKGEQGLVRAVRQAVEQAGFAGIGRDRAFYLVGGSWRALARLDMMFSGHPLPITHQHAMAPGRPAELESLLAGLDKARARAIPSLSSSRIPTIPAANLLLKALVAALKPRELVVSAYGIREGLLFHDLDPAERARDPLIEAAREAGTGLGRFAPHGDLLDRWIAPIFDDDPPAARLRLAACLLADIAWAAHPDFRAERGVDMALHGNWVGIDGPGRVMLAQALFANFGGGGAFSDLAPARICDEAALKRAFLWGLAMRLGQRLSGGVAAGLERSRLRIDGDALLLELPGGEEALFGEAVERRLRTLAGAMGLKARAAASL
ncbi:MAG: Ppx/GppA family phosphatase [Allosphingosinicella sp.]|uniref:Ppx/GppA phosphatase family protein n=1 Tax=Allosphingosinicella sp. TaxID=2823234 RepID=UPI00396047FE